MAQLKLMCETLDIERGGTKENIVERIIDFLMSPHTSGKPLKQNKARTYLVLYETNAQKFRASYLKTTGE